MLGSIHILQKLKREFVGGAIFDLSHLIWLKVSRMVILVSLHCFCNINSWGRGPRAPYCSRYLLAPHLKQRLQEFYVNIPQKIKFNKYEEWETLNVIKLTNYYHSVAIKVKCMVNNLDNHLRTQSYKDNFINE